MGDIHPAERLGEGLAQLEPRIIVNDWTGEIPNFALDLLDAAAEVTHQALRRFVQSREAVGGDEHFRTRLPALFSELNELMAHFEQVFDQIDLNLDSALKKE
jgi:hypothetical protein